MYNPSKIRGICPKSCYLRLSSNLLMNVMQQLARIQCMAQCQGPRAQMTRLILSSLIFGMRMLRKSPKVPRDPSNENSARAITCWLEGVTNYCSVLQQQFTSTSSVLGVKILLKKKISRWNAHWTNYQIGIERAWAPLTYACSTIGYFYDKTNISYENLLVSYYLPQKYYRRQSTLLLLPWPNH